MAQKTQKAVILKEYGGKPEVQEVPVPTLEEGQLLVKVAASTINPSDRIFILGQYFKKPLPTTCGFEGTGVVVEANGEALQGWVGKRVTFSSMSGTWAEYAVTSPLSTFEIDNDVTLASGASGVVNPLTVVGFVENWKTNHGGKGGIIHTAAASSLGLKLNKLCLSLGVPLLNIVRSEHSAVALRKQGATNIIVTTGDWVQEYKNQIKTHGFNVLYDALGGGPTTDLLISNLGKNGTYYIYGVLESKPLTVSNTTALWEGIVIKGLLVFNWWTTVQKEDQDRIREQYSKWLKNQLSTETSEQINIFEDINRAIEVSVSKANDGKVLLKL